jgi:hypothetical protein
MRLSALSSASATTNKPNVFQLLRNKSAHVMLYPRNTKLLSSRIASKPNSCAEGASTGKQKEFVDPYLADDSYCLTHSTSALRELGNYPWHVSPPLMVSSGLMILMQEQHNHKTLCSRVVSPRLEKGRKPAKDQVSVYKVHVILLRASTGNYSIPILYRLIIKVDLSLQSLTESSLQTDCSDFERHSISA